MDYREIKPGDKLINALNRTPVTVDHVYVSSSGELYVQVVEDDGRSYRIDPEDLEKDVSAIPYGTPVLVTLRGTFDMNPQSDPDAAYATVYDDDGDSLYVRVKRDRVAVTSPDVAAGQMYRLNGSTYVVTRDAALSEGGQLVVTNVLDGSELTPNELVGAKLLADHEDLI